MARNSKEPESQALATTDGPPNTARNGFAESLFTDDPAEKQRDLKAALEAVFDETAIEQKAVLTSEQAAALVMASVYTRRYNSVVGAYAIRFALIYGVSIKGRGRNDMVSAIRAMLASAEDIGDNLKSRLLGVPGR